jgi:hypothetical protein
VIFSYQQRSLDVIDGLPHIVALWVSLPLDQVLELASITSVGSNCLDFILFFTLDHVRWWPRVVLAMFHGFDIRHKK